MNAAASPPKPGPLDDLDERSRDVFRRIVDGYLERGEATGSRTLSRDMPVSPATIRNVMSDLEHLGLIYAPHVSAGRMPTETGLRMFVDGLMEVGDLGPAERERIESQIGRPRVRAWVRPRTPRACSPAPPRSCPRSPTARASWCRPSTTSA